MIKLMNCLFLFHASGDHVPIVQKFLIVVFSAYYNFEIMVSQHKVFNRESMVGPVASVMGKFENGLRKQGRPGGYWYPSGNCT